MQKILIASPDKVVLDILRLSVSPMGIEYRTSDNEKEFVENCLEDCYDLIVTQFTHPFLNGFDLSRKMRLKHGHKPPVFLLSPILYEQHLLSLYESGVDQYLTLPVALSRLERKIRSQLKIKVR